MRLSIEKLVYGGAGLAHEGEGADEGKAVFVPFTLPGEVVEARLAEKQGEATLLEILTPSASRVAPGCAHFGECGGCHYQHASYRAQVAAKAAILREMLGRAALTALPEIQQHSAEPWGYRNRSRLRVERHNGTLRVGYNRRGSNEFLPIHECPISAPLIWRACEALLRVTAEDSPAGRWTQHLAEVELFVTGDQAKLQMTAFVRKDHSGFGSFCDRLRELLPELAGAGAMQAAAPGPRRRAQRPRSLSSWGAPGMSYAVAEEDYWVSRGSFFQVNRFLLEDLVETLTAQRKGKLAWDLYAGVGLFSRALARGFEQVVAVEAAGDDLLRTFQGAGRRAVQATTVEFLRGAVVQRERPELIVMDPPRAGVGDEVCALLARLSTPDVVYISCDPATLARDLKRLAETGYRIAELHLFDLFPQTFHLETVAVLRR